MTQFAREALARSEAGCTIEELRGMIVSVPEFDRRLAAKPKLLTDMIARFRRSGEISVEEGRVRLAHRLRRLP